MNIEMVHAANEFKGRGVLKNSTIPQGVTGERVFRMKPLERAKVVM